MRVVSSVREQFIPAERRISQSICTSPQEEEILQSIGPVYVRINVQGHGAGLGDEGVDWPDARLS